MCFLHVLVENLLLVPFLFLTYLLLEAVEDRAQGRLARFVWKTRRWGPLAGALAGTVPQCGFSAAMASLYAGGVVTAGTLAAVFLSTSDELIPVLLSAQVPAGVLFKIVGLKVAFGLFVGVVVDAVLARCRPSAAPRQVADLCAHSHCGCGKRHGIVVPALIHTAEIFAFILIVSGVVHVLFHQAGPDVLKGFVLNRPVVGELLGGLLGLVPNCAASVAAARLYVEGGMSAGALLASSLTGSGIGLLVLFRTNRRWRENLLFLVLVYGAGTVCGMLGGLLF